MRSLRLFMLVCLCAICGGCVETVSQAPLPIEVCDDERDNDGDGMTDCEDLDCLTAMVCTTEQCARPGDEDGDGLYNCEDPDCAPNACLAENCTNNMDDDGDGMTDCEDRECRDAPTCLPEDCTRRGDEDNDGLSNCEDPDCREAGGFPPCSMIQGSKCSIAAPFVCEGGEMACDDNNDNDSDGFSDCNDSDCQNSCRCKQCAELCNGVDDDMDGVSDEGCACVFQNKTQGVCADSVLNNIGECAVPSTYNPTTDLCEDELDNDCNGVVNDGCPCDYQNIGVGICRVGVLQSDGQCARPLGYADSESNSLCDDGQDNDCDGDIDDEDSGCSM